MWNRMSNECCKVFTGWVKSFTKLERALTVLEALLLVVLVTLLILLILHLIVCSKSDHWTDDFTSTAPFQPTSAGDQEDPIDNPTTESGHLDSNKSAHRSTAKPDVKCSWTPSAKTTALHRYYEEERSQGSIPYKAEITTRNLIETPVLNETISSRVTEVDETRIFLHTEVTDIMDSDITSTTPIREIEELIPDELSDGEEAEDQYDQHVLALVKLKPPTDIIFGCILTIVSEYWVLTAASCIEAIEETDSLDSFVIMEHYGTDKKGPLRAIDDVQIHPLYEGKNKSYDLAALRSANSLTRGMHSPVELASFLDFALSALAHRFIILGYGAFRNIDIGPAGRRLRQAHVYKLPARQCAGEGGGAGAGGGGGAALRHLSDGRAVARGACGAAALCAGVLHSRGLPCNYCAGTPLLLAGGGGAGGALLGLMAGGEQCAVSCEPALYVNLADVDIADWVDATLRSDIIH